MHAHTRRRAAALLLSTSLVASLVVVTTAAPAAAVPTCDGRAATITDNDGTDGNPAVGIIDGTGGPDVIVGSAGVDVIDGFGGRDIICGLESADAIEGGSGNDRIFGGAGDDEILGGDGPDVLKGNGGNDTIRGNRGNDNIDGGPASDDCKQNSGSGRIVRCERADLKVTLISPNSANADDFKVKIKVKNRGPNGSSYGLVLDDRNNVNVWCICPEEGELLQFAKLRSGQTRTRTFDIPCGKTGDPASVEMWVQVFPDARDPRRGNNKDEHETDINQVTVDPRSSSRAG